MNNYFLCWRGFANCAFSFRFLRLRKFHCVTFMVNKISRLRRCRWGCAMNKKKIPINFGNLFNFSFKLQT